VIAGGPSVTLGLCPSRFTATTRLLNQKSRSLSEVRRDSKDLADAVSDAGKKTATNGTGTGADATGRRTTQAPGYGSGRHSFSKIPKAEASGHQIKFTHGKLVGRCAVSKVLVHAHSPFAESGPDDGSPQSTALLSTGLPSSLLDGVLRDI
jgi:hypothetical protein